MISGPLTKPTPDPMSESFIHHHTMHRVHIHKKSCNSIYSPNSSHHLTAHYIFTIIPELKNLNNHLCVLWETGDERSAADARSLRINGRNMVNL